MNRGLLQINYHLKKRATRYLALGVLLILAADLPLRGQGLQTIPSPDEAIQRAEQLSPEDLVNVQIDAEIRDRLRFDPAWQPMVQAVRQDIMTIKWGDGQLTNPVWQQYGAKAYPLLDYYTRTADSTRQAYGIVGIRSLGKPYATLWLERQLTADSSATSFYWITQDPKGLLNQSAYDPSYDPDQWQTDFGLDDPATRDRLIAIAQANVAANSPDPYGSFSLSFLEAMLGYEAVHPEWYQSEESEPPALPEWDRLEPLTQPTEAQIQEAIAFYQGLPHDQQDYLLAQRLGSIKAGDIGPVGKALLQSLANTPDSPDRVWAIAELNRHGDPEAEAALQEVLNGDLSQLYPLTDLVQYDYSFEDDLEKATHAYYLLIAIAEQYPNSKFIRASREYGDLTGQSYFGGEPRSQAILDRNQAKTAAERSRDWQSWLERYPDHPGSDDATYWLARSLQDQNQILDAMDHWVKLMTQSVGDGDAVHLAYPHVRTMLDVGLTTEQLETLVERYRDTAIQPLFQYALAVRYARSHQYDRALQTSEGLEFAALTPVLESYYEGWVWRTTFDQAEAMQTMLTEQRQRWQQLQQWQDENTPESRYEMASNWAGRGGWKNGYLPVWDEGRTDLLPTGVWSDYYCQKFWVCNAQLRSAEDIQASYQTASQNAIATSLYQQLLDDPQTPPNLREKALFMQASTLLWQWENHPLGETFRIHPVFKTTSSAVAPSPSADSYEAWQANYDRVEQDYLTYLDQAIAALQQTFPTSVYIDDLLFSRYALSGDQQYLRQIVEQYGRGDRAAEAQFLLGQGGLRTNRP